MSLQDFIKERRRVLAMERQGGSRIGHNGVVVCTAAQPGDGGENVQSRSNRRAVRNTTAKIRQKKPKGKVLANRSRGKRAETLSSVKKGKCNNVMSKAQNAKTEHRNSSPGMIESIFLLENTLMFLPVDASSVLLGGGGDK